MIKRSIFVFSVILMLTLVFRLSAQTVNSPAKSTTTTVIAPAVVPVVEPAKVKIEPAKKDALSKKLEMRREELRQDGRCKKKEKKEESAK